MDSPPLNNTSTDTGPEAIRKNFAAVATATDTPLPGDGTRQMTVDLGQQILPLARNVGMFMRSAPLFRFGESIVTVNESGRIALMTSERFTSWVESYLSFTERVKDTVTARSIGKDRASLILKSDQFQDQLRELKAVSEVRIPVSSNEGGTLKVELSPEGFHEPTGLYTVNRIPYQEDMPPAEAWQFIWDSLHQFPFDPEGESHIKNCRSFSAQVAIMVGSFCHALFSEGTAKPMIIHLANQSGSGKSLLMRMALSPVFGPPADHGKPDTESEMEKLLDMTAAARKPFLVLDDCKSLHSQALNRFITSPRHAWRVMYSQNEASIAKTTQVFATGNGLTVSPDLERRSLCVDLFCASEATERTFAREITLRWLFADQTRAKFLAALWCLVRTWISQGYPMMKEHRRGSFEDWSAMVGGIVIASGYANPFKPRNADAVGGDESTRALKMILARIVGEAATDAPPVLDTSMILERAEADSMLELIFPYSKDPKKSLGNKLKPLLERELFDTQNRMFEFGKRNISKGARYPVKFFDVAP